MLLRSLTFLRLRYLTECLTNFFDFLDFFNLFFRLSQPPELLRVVFLEYCLLLASFLFFLNLSRCRLSINFGIQSLGLPLLDVFLTELEGMSLSMLEVQGVKGQVARVC